MTPDDKEASELIRAGRYYDEARRWYTALYISPITERSVFLGLSLLAGIVALLGFLALGGLTPLTDRSPVMIANPRMDDTIPNLIRLRAKGDNVREALRDYYVQQYIYSREQYLADTYRMNNLFVTGHSQDEAASSYAAAVASTNPQSPVNSLGAYGKRTVRILSMDIREAGDEATAQVRFSTETSGLGNIVKSQWTATLRFYYSGGEITETVDPQTNRTRVTVQEPIFHVSNYAATKL